jgi:hypothetical protein
MDSTLDTADSAMLKNALKTLTIEQLANALDAGVRLLEAWRVSPKQFTSGRRAQIAGTSQFILAVSGPNRPIRTNGKNSSQE